MGGAADDSLLTGDRIRQLLIELAEELAVAGESGELFIVGGAALALGCDARALVDLWDELILPKHLRAAWEPVVEAACATKA